MLKIKIWITGSKEISSYLYKLLLISRSWVIIVLQNNLNFIALSNVCTLLLRTGTINYLHNLVYRPIAVFHRPTCFCVNVKYSKSTFFIMRPVSDFKYTCSFNLHFSSNICCAHALYQINQDPSAQRGPRTGFLSRGGVVPWAPVWI